MDKVDLLQALKPLYTPSSKAPVLVDIPALNFLMVEGSGDPNTAPAFSQAMEALYTVAYTLKFTGKRGPAAVDFKVMPPEALWWAEDCTAFTERRKEEWQWTVMVAVPDIVTAEMVAAAVALVREKKNPPALSKLRFERFEEGLCVQIMHLGPYDAERPTIELLHAFAAGQGYALRGKHHEIYLSDPRRAKPEKMKTIIRQPVVKL